LHPLLDIGLPLAASIRIGSLPSGAISFPLSLLYCRSIVSVDDQHFFYVALDCHSLVVSHAPPNAISDMRCAL